MYKFCDCGYNPVFILIDETLELKIVICCKITVRRKSIQYLMTLSL